MRAILLWMVSCREMKWQPEKARQLSAYLGGFQRFRPGRHVTIEEPDVADAAKGSKESSFEARLTPNNSAELDEPALRIPIPERFDCDGRGSRRPKVGKRCGVGRVHQSAQRYPR